MARFVVLLLCACMLFAPRTGSAAESNQAPLGMLDLGHSKAHLTASKTGPEFTTISLNSPEISVQDQTVDYRQYKVFGIPGEPYLSESGHPTVPQVSRFYRIPNLGGAELIVQDAEYDLLEGVDALPFQPDSGSFPRMIKDDMLYNTDGWYPPNVAVMSDPMIMRDFRVVQVTLYPVQVNPVTHQARVYHTLNVNVVANNLPSTNELTNPRPPSGAWEKVYRSMITNLDDNALDNVTHMPGSILIATKDNAIPKRWADSLAIWKLRQGYRVIEDVRTSAAWTSEALITAVHNAYANWDPPLEFVIIVGDPQATWGIPCHGDAWSGDFDHMYGLGNTGDDLEDVGVGRLSGGDDTKLATINKKIMMYERNPTMTDTMWYHKAFLYAGVARSCAGNYLLMQWAKDQFKAYTDVDSAMVGIHTGDGVVNSDITSKINGGISYFLWRGSWISGMPSNIADNTTPNGRFPITMTITCSAGEYNSSSGIDSPAEDFLCAGDPTTPRGGVSGIGTSTSRTQNADITLAGGMIYNIADVQVEHLGVAAAAAKASLYSNFGMQTDPEGGNLAPNFTRYFNLLGDPSLSMWTGVPIVMAATYPSILNVGTHEVTVSVRRAGDQVPLQDALVVLWKRGADSTWVRGLTNSEGVITLPVSINAPGDLLLTVTKRGHCPLLNTIVCSQADQMAMVSSFFVPDDDNTGGTHGNGDHVMNPSETIDLPVFIKNFGATATASNVSATMTSNNSRVVVQTASSTFGNIAPGDSIVGNVPFRIHIDPSMQNAETVQLTVNVTTAAGSQAGCIELHCVGVHAGYMTQSFDTPFNSGSTSNLHVTVHNYGATTLSGVSGHLVSLSPWVSVDDGNAAFGDILDSSNATNTSDVFTLTSNTLTFPGHQAPMLLILTTNTGTNDTVQFIVTVGSAAPTDPTGPDAYGYFAYDNSDMNYDMHPNYNYVDISASGGENLNLSDGGEQTSYSSVWAASRRLPFAFKFYGHVYDTLTVCSNGWCAFGNQTSYSLFRNYPIPAMVAPDAMIAPYFDDLATTGTGRGVWVKSDPENHRYIVQWKANAWNGGAYSSPLDFEVMLYDTTYTPTMDGNGEVVVQYNVVSVGHANQYGDEAPGCTVGVQAPRGLVGLSYLFNTSYAPGAAALVSGRSILFTTAARMLFGSIAGTVRAASDSLPLAGAAVTVDGYSYHATSDVNGHYRIDNVLIGTYTVRAGRYRHNDATVANLLVELDSVETANFYMTRPVFSLSENAVIDTCYRAPVTAHFNINNSGNGPLDYAITVRWPGDSVGSTWDSVGGLQVSHLSNDYQIYGCEFAFGQWWVVGSGHSSGHHALYRYNRDGASVGQPVILESSNPNDWFDLAFDGQLIWGSEGHNIVGVDSLGQIQKRISSPLNPSRAIAYDPGSHHFWVADYTSDIFEIDTIGNIIQHVEGSALGGLAITGMAWNSTDPNGYKLLIYSQDGSGRYTRVTRAQAFPPFRTEIVRDALPGQPGDRSGGCAVTPSWNSTLLVFGAIVQSPAGDKLDIFDVMFNTTWISVAPDSFHVTGPGSRDISVRFDPASLQPDTYYVDLHVRSAVCDTTVIMPVTLIVLEGESAVPDPTHGDRVTEYALAQNYPNPFNPTTTIHYELKSDGFTRLVVYNLMGEKVAELVNGRQPAGVYQVNFDASALSSGVYFYRLESGNYTKVQKMVLMK